MPSTLVGSLLSFLGTATLAIFGWAFQINSKVNVQAATQQVKHDDLKELINERFDGIIERFNYTDGRIARIEKAMNGKLKD